MSLISEYINKRLSVPELESELLRLISEYNNLRDTYLFVYSVAIWKQQIPALPLEQSDFYVIYDFLTKKKGTKKIDVYLETPGGSGETAEDIVRFLRKNFETVCFVVSGEAKSAGTLITLSGDEILMTETGSLGPIDAQIRIGRSIASAYDYMDWVEKKRKEAEETKKLNPFDATMVAQITPGELGGVFHALKFAEDLVVEWLTKYKFKNWIKTETRQMVVTEEMRKTRAEQIAKELTNHSKWRSHGRSIKIWDLEQIGLKIKRVDDDPQLTDIVYRIQTVCNLIFETSTTFKIFATQDDKIFRQAVPIGAPLNIQKVQEPDTVQIEQKCSKCGNVSKLYAKLVPNMKIDEDMQKKGFRSFPKDAKIVCSCGFEMDLSGIKNQIENQTGKRIIVD